MTSSMTERSEGQGCLILRRKKFQAEIAETFKVPTSKLSAVYIVGCKVKRNAQVRLVRDGIVIHEGTIFTSCDGGRCYMKQPQAMAVSN